MGHLGIRRLGAGLLSASSAPERAKKPGLYHVPSFRSTLPLELLDDQRSAEALELCSLCYEVLQAFGAPVTLTKLRTHWRVRELLKAPAFEGQRFYSLLQRHPEVFKLECEEDMDTSVGNSLVALQLDAASRLPQAPVARVDEQLLARAGLPERIEKPETLEEIVQAIRIETIHELHSRGGSVELADLGASVGVLKFKALLTAKYGQVRLLSILKQFPRNFRVPEVGTAVPSRGLVALLSTSVVDRLTYVPIEAWLRVGAAPPHRGGAGHWSSSSSESSGGSAPGRKPEGPCEGAAALAAAARGRPGRAQELVLMLAALVACFALGVLHVQVPGPLAQGVLPYLELTGRALLAGTAAAGGVALAEGWLRGGPPPRLPGGAAATSCK